MSKTSVSRDAPCAPTSASCRNDGKGPESCVGWWCKNGETVNLGHLIPVFKLLCDEMGREHTTLLLRTEIRWLYKGKVLVRVPNFPRTSNLFVIDHSFYLSHGVANTSW